jgi:hypothetical protein
MPSTVKVEPTEANRFSTFVRPKDKAGLRLLEGWVKHFTKVGETAEIHQTYRGFAVYKAGMIECPDVD